MTKASIPADQVRFFSGSSNPALAANIAHELGVAGFYRCVHNPMYVGVLLILIGYFLWFGFWSLLAYAGLAWLATHLFVTLYEERPSKESSARRMKII